MNEGQPESLSSEDKIALILRTLDVNVMTIGTRGVGGENDWSYETPETIAKSVWGHAVGEWFIEDGFIDVRINAFTDDKVYQVHPVIKDNEDRRLLLLGFHISKDQVKFKVQAESPRHSEQILMPLDQVFQLAMTSRDSSQE